MLELAAGVVDLELTNSLGSVLDTLPISIEFEFSFNTSLSKLIGLISFKFALDSSFSLLVSAGLVFSFSSACSFNKMSAMVFVSPLSKPSVSSLFIDWDDYDTSSFSCLLDLPLFNAESSMSFSMTVFILDLF